MRSKPKTVICWLAASLGVLVGLFELAQFGMWWLPYGDPHPGWLLRWLTFIGIGLLALGLLIGSIIAPRNPKRAGIIFLLFLPITAFCLAWQESGFLVWHADGSGWFETPSPLTAIGLTVLFFVPFVVPLPLLRHKKRAAIVFAAATFVAVTVFIRSHWTSVLLPHLAAYSAPFALFGLFWLGTYKFGWPSLVQPRPRGVARRIAALLITCLVVLCLDVALTLGLSALNSSLFSADCAGKAPITHPESARHAVFTARTIFVGRSISALTRGTGVHGLAVGDWAIGVVRERFWGVPSRWPHLVLMTNYIYWKDETYFIDGVRENGLLARALPIVEARVGCSRSRPVAYAVIDLRVLHEAPATGSTRLIGYVKEPEAFRGVFQPPIAPTFAAGARIDVTGKEGTKTTTTDQTGIYRFDGLPPGDYTLRLVAPDDRVVSLDRGRPVHLSSGGVAEHDFDLFWNGRIEGRVKEDSGNPARASLLLSSADGSDSPDYSNFTPLTSQDGSYQIKSVPPGRYTLMMNPYGPNDESPYDVRYYRLALRSRDAQVLELGPGQKIKGIDFKVRRLTQQAVQVHVTRANGSAAAGSHVCVVYEHAKEYDSLQSAGSVKDADQNGLALIYLYGNSRVRVFAEQLVDNAKENGLDTRYSHFVESEASKMPDKIDLLLTSAKP